MERTSANMQGTGQVWRAELRRAGRQGGWRRISMWSVIVSLAIGGGTLATLGTISAAADEPGSVVITFPVEVTAIVASFMMALGMAMSVARDSQGMLTISLTNVPHRRRLLTAQMGSAFVWSTMVVAATALVALAAATLVTPSASGATLAMSSTVAGSLAGGLMGCISYQLGRLVAHPAIAVLVVLGWWLVLPMALVSVGLFLPSSVQTVIEKVVEGAPSALLVNAARASGLDTQGPEALIIGFVGLASWAVLLGGVVLAASAKREH